MLKVYRECDPQAERAAAEMHATCSEGCAACCRLLVLILFAEAVTIARHLLIDPAWRDKLPALRARLGAQLDEYSPNGLTNVAHWDKQIPCAFLGKDNRCQIYSVRPASCRYHYAVSPPINCSHGAADPIVVSINLTQLKAHAWTRAVDVQGSAGKLGGPLPLMVLAALMMLEEPDLGLDEQLDGLIARPTLLDMGVWMGVERQVVDPTIEPKR